MAVVQHFTIEHPEAGEMTEHHQWTLTRSGAESLFQDLGVSLYGEDFQTSQGAVHAASQDLASLVEALRGHIMLPTGGDDTPPWLPDPESVTVSTEELAAQRQAMANVEQAAREEIRGGHLASPHQPRGSAIGTRHVDG